MGTKHINGVYTTDSSTKAPLGKSWQVATDEKDGDRLQQGKKKAVSHWRSSGQLCRHRGLTNLSWEMHLWPSAGSTNFSYVPWIVHCQGTSQYVSVLYIAFLNYVHDTYIVSVYPQWIYENDFCNWISLMYLRIQFQGTNRQAHLTKSLYVFQISNKEIDPFESISFYIF